MTVGTATRVLWTDWCDIVTVGTATRVLWTDWCDIVTVGSTGGTSESQDSLCL
jgi:hypothetical protein